MNKSQTLILTLLTVLFVISCKPERRRSSVIDTSSNTTETPSIAEQDTLEQYIDLEIPYIDDDRPRQILRREAYTACYNHDTRCPNWVAWVLTSYKVHGDIERKVWYDDAGNAIGINNFAPSMVKGEYIFDNEAESPKPDFSDWDYKPQGASHGHMCPAADCKFSKAAMNQSFLLTNICVQAEKLNSGSWNKLEMKCRDWASRYGRIFIVAGPVFVNGKVTSTMGQNKVAIPDGFFKVVLCMEGNPKAIGFVYGNNNDKHKMEDAVYSIDEIEKLTGIDFFPQLPNDIEDDIESQSSLNAW